MKICVSCSAQFRADGWRCPGCHYAPPEQNGIPLFAAALANGNDGFNVEHFRELAEIEAGHFWFRNRNRLLLWAMEAYFPSARRFLEIGCGTGFVLNGIRKGRPGIQVSGSELSLQGLAVARTRLPDVPLFQMNALQIPFAAEFDVVGAFDVLEHIEEDEKVLGQIHQAIVSGGGLLITVPQHPSLWSETDTRACHKRRYTRQELLGKVRAAGFEVRRATSFVTLLLPLFWWSRRRQGVNGKGRTDAECPKSPMLNRLLEAILFLEAGGIRTGMNFPAGGSLLLVGQKI